SAVHVEEPTILAIRALPVVHAAIADGALTFVNPDFLAGRRVERDDREALAERVHHAVDDDRVEPERPLIAGRVGPRDLELGDVLLADLIERRVLRRIGAAQVFTPGVELRLALLLCAEPPDADNGQRRQANGKCEGA